MQITILGGGGFLGRKLAARLAKDGTLGGRPITGLTLFDLAAPKPMPAPFPLRCLGGDVADPAAPARLAPVAEAAREHVRVLAALALAAEGLAPRPLPDVADRALGDQVAVLGHDVAAALDQRPDDDLLARALACLLELRRTLPA